MTFRSPPRAALASLLAAALLACGGGDAPREDAAGEEAAEAAETPEAAPAAETAPAASPTSAPLTPDDIDRWAKGMEGELEAVQEAAARHRSAKTGEDTLSAMMGAQEMSTVEAGAAAAGVDPERYKVIRSNLSAAAGYLTPELGGIDTTMLSPEQRAEMRQMNEAQLKQLEAQVPVNVLDALRPRAAELRKQSLELVAARLKAAGM